MSAVKEELVLQPTEGEIPHAAGIGGSDIAAIVGVHEFTSAFDVWLEKTGRAPADVVNEAMEMGAELEPTILSRYEKKFGVSLIRPCPRIRHHERAWQTAQTDGIAPRESLVVEAKYSGYAKAWGEESDVDILTLPDNDKRVPDYALMQTIWNMNIRDYEFGDIALYLINFRPVFRRYRVGKHPDIEDSLLSAGYEFMTKHVQADIPPTPKDTERTRDWLKKSFPRNLEPLRQATPEEEAAAQDLRVVRAKRETYEKAEKDLKVQLSIAIGSAEGIQGEFGKITFKKDSDSMGPDWKAVASELAERIGVTAELPSIAGKHIVVTREGPRKFVPTFKKE
jgi:putative phage-type endonuclease